MADIPPPDERAARNRAKPPATRNRNRKKGRGKPPRNGSRPSGDNRARPGAEQGARVAEKAPVAARAPASQPFVPRQAYAAIDLGTNNCRLLIARPSGESFTVIDAFSRVVRLGEGVAQTGRLSEEAMNRALAALKVCAEKLKRRRVRLARSVATEACRRAENGDDFINRVREETGIVLDVISAREEARLAVLGCHILLEEGDGPALIFDIGGGSTELVLIDAMTETPRMIDWVSVPWGVVSLTESCAGEENSPEARASRYDQMRTLVRESFAEFAGRTAPLAGQEVRLLGTSGTVTTLASLHLELPQYDRRAVDGLIVPAHSMRSISQRLAGMSATERADMPGLGRERSDLVIAGCAILESILDIWPADRLGVADRGIREGILRSLIASDLSFAPQRPATAPQRNRQKQS